MLRFFKNPDFEELPQEVAHVEIDEKHKPPRQIPVLKIILSVFLLGVMIALIVGGIYLLIMQDKYKDLTEEAKTKIEATVKDYPKPLPNICDEEVKMCESGTLVKKNPKTCSKFETCPEFAADMTKFWDAKAQEDYIITYKNLDLDYEFDLLKTWDFIGKDYGFILYSPNYECGKEVATTSDTACDGTIIEMLSSNTTAKTDIEEWYESGENHIIRNSDNPPPETTEIIDFAGQNAIKAKNSRNTYTYFFIKNNNVYILRTTSAGDLDFELAEPFIEGIIETFKFTDVE